jgi:DNA replication protein DnaC
LRNDWQRTHIGLEVTFPEVQRMADAAERFASAFFHAGRTIGGPASLVFAGASGIGKSHIAKRLYKWCRAASFNAAEQGFWKRPPSIIFVEWPSVSDGFKNGEYGVLQDLFSADLAFLDDIGAEYDPSKLATEKLCQVLSKREGKFSFITTNIQQSNWATHFDSRVEDRLLRRTKIISVFNIKSYQLAK